LPSEPLWVPVDLVIEANRSEVARSEPPEPHLILDPGKLEGAIMRPQHHWNYGNDDVVLLAAVYLTGIAAAHAFEQGNKRTAFIAAKSFLEGNGFAVLLDDTDEVADIVIASVKRELSFDDIVEFLRRGTEYIGE
jgi:death-on-curing protein